MITWANRVLRGYLAEGDLGTCRCGHPMGRGALVLTTLLETVHTACATPDERAAAVCPACTTDHPQPYDGTCLL